MTVRVAILIVICTIIIIIEEWYTNNQPVPNTSDLLVKKSTSKPNPVKFANNFSIDVEVIDLRKSHLAEQTNWRRFLSFFSLTSFFGSLSGLLVRYRQHQLRFKSLSRFRDRDSPDTSCATGDDSHTLIDMSQISH